MSTFLVVGDFMVDRYLIAYARGPSAEVPSLKVLTVTEEFERSGGAGNVAENLVALGDHAICLARMPYPVKNRIIVLGEQVVRFDQDDWCYPVDIDRLKAFVAREDIDGIVVADYAKGAITIEMCDVLVKAGKPLFVDTKRDPSVWANASYAWLFPNSGEFELYEEAYRKAEQVVWKKGPNGVVRLHYGIEIESYPAFLQPKQVVDVCGAGDTVMAAFASHLMANEPITPLAYANAAAAVACSKRFTSTVTKSEILQLFNDTAVQRLYC